MAVWMLSNCVWAAEKAINVFCLVYTLSPFSISFWKRITAVDSNRIFLYNLVYNLIYFLKTILDDISHFCGPTNIGVLDFWWHLIWVSKPGWIPFLHASSPLCNGFHRFTSGATPADHLVAGHAAEPFDPHSCSCTCKHCVAQYALVYSIILIRIHWYSAYTQYRHRL